MKTKATLTLNLTYEGPDATNLYIRSLLDFMVEHAANNGMFTSDANMVVDSWNHSIELESLEDGGSDTEDKDDEQGVGPGRTLEEHLAWQNERLNPDGSLKAKKD
jgi:hypothetical protein